MPTGAVTPSVASYFFAGPMLDASDDCHGGAEGDGKVPARQRSGLLLAVAMWSLRNNGTVSLEHVVHKRMGVFTTHDVIIAPTSDVRTEGSDGLECALLGLVRGHGPRRIESVISAWLGCGVDRPEDKVIECVRSAALEQGFIHEATWREESDGRTTIATAAGKALLDQWRGFALAEPNLSYYLTKRCDRALIVRDRIPYDVIRS